jgi:hypothetical protein
MLNSGVSSSGETVEKLLTIGVSATGKSCCKWCCSRGRGEKEKQVLDGVVSEVRMMGGMGCFYDWGEMKSVDQRCLGVGEAVTSVLQWCFGIGEVSSAAQRCSNIMKNHQCCKTVFQHRESLFSLKNRSFLCFDPANINCRAIFL